MVTKQQLDRSKDIQQRTGRTFHFATRLLPERVRHPTYVLYAFFRVADEVVDAEEAQTRPAADRRAALERIREAALGRREADDPVLAAFAELRERHGIDPDDVEVFVDAMLSDVDTERYETYADLEAYMDGSAAAVGRMMTAVMAPDDPERARPHATALGEAFQLTNFLRDVREDVLERDRIYLPRETLERYGVTTDEVRHLTFSDRFERAMRHELARAEDRYRRGVAGIEYLPDDCQFAVLLAAVLYAEHHRLIRKQGYDVLASTPTLGTLRSVWLCCRTRWHWQWTRDPEAVFEAVSAVGVDDPTSHPGGRAQSDGVLAR